MCTSSQLCANFVLTRPKTKVKVAFTCGEALWHKIITAEAIACDYWPDGPGPGCEFEPDWHTIDWQEVISQAVVQPLQQAILAKQLEFQVRDLTTQLTVLKKTVEQKPTTKSG